MQERQETSYENEPVVGEPARGPSTPRWVWWVGVGWLVLVGGSMPVLAMFVDHSHSHQASAAQFWGLVSVGTAATLAFGFVLGRWSGLAAVGCAAPLGCLSWVFGFVLGYAMTSTGGSTDDSGAMGVMVLGVPVLSATLVLLAVGAGVGSLLRRS